MNFSQQPYIPGETVAAIATPPGEGGVAIIRISGKNARSVAQKIYSKSIEKYKSHTVHYGHVIDGNGLHIDDVLLIPMLGSKSFTGEDTFEIHCHGGSLITRRVLDAVLKAGARAALPGEFSFKAYMNGKIDLAQAEAIQELIAAKNDRALDAAESQLQGNLSKKVISFQKKLTEIAAILEAWVDFPEEGLEFASLEDVCWQIESVLQEIQQLIDTFHDGRIIHDGIALCLVGSPNVGKSSLMNALLDKERAIVSHIPGTTRDIVEDTMRLNGMSFRIIDTAGIREAAEEIEEEGIRRSHGAIANSDLILLILDASEGVRESELELIKKLPRQKTIAVWNKIDISAAKQATLGFDKVVEISAKEKSGLQSLYTAIDSAIWSKGAPSKDEIVITNIRHKESLQKAAEACSQLLHGLRTELSPEFLSIDMRACLVELGKIIGTNIGEDILTAIFSKFCIGK